MAFVKIKKSGKGIKSIPSGTLEAYLRSGWEVVDGTLETKANKSMAKEENASEGKLEASEGNAKNDDTVKDEWDEVEAEENDEKSIDEMTVSELQNKAKELCIDTKNLTTVGALRKAIRRANNRQ